MAVLFTDVVDSADVGMVQRGSSFCLAAETLKRLRILGQSIGKKLQRYKAVKTSVLGLVDNTHSAIPEFFENAVVGNGSVE